MSSLYFSFEILPLPSQNGHGISSSSHIPTDLWGKVNKVDG